VPNSRTDTNTAPFDANLVDIVDLLAETPLPLTQLAMQEGVHTGTTARWAGRGVNGIKLESYRRAGRRCTTVEAFARWQVRLNAASQSTQVRSRTNRRKKSDVKQAEETLKREGV